MKIITITSRDNGFIKDLKRLAREASAYRRLGYVWLEGDHLCRAALTRGLRADTAVFSDSYWSETSKEWAQTASKVVILPDALFAEISALESPAKMGFILPWQGAATQLQPGVATDRSKNKALKVLATDGHTFGGFSCGWGGWHLREDYTSNPLVDS